MKTFKEALVLIPGVVLFALVMLLEGAADLLSRCAGAMGQWAEKE